jgi:hypothetical protein
MCVHNDYDLSFFLFAQEFLTCVLQQFQYSELQEQNSKCLSTCSIFNYWKPAYMTEILLGKGAKMKQTNKLLEHYLTLA